MIFVLSCLLSWAGDVLGLEPSQVLVVVNRDSEAGSRLAGFYMRERKIPPGNLLEVSLPTTDSMSRDTYETRLAGPLRLALRRPDRARRIQCILLTYGIPLRIEPTPLTRPEKVKRAGLMEELKAVEALLGPGDVPGERLAGLKRRKRDIEQELRRLDHGMEAASVDSELMLVRLKDYRLDGWIPNPLFVPNRARRVAVGPQDVIMVCRLDAPEPRICMRMVKDSLYAEENGLAGKAYFDCRYPRPPSSGVTPYQAYDLSLRRASGIVGRLGHMDVVLDTSPKVFPPGSCPDAAIYCGWYSLARYVDAFGWQRGAVAFHVASGECVTLHGGGRGWCKMLLLDGVAATLGPVAEPFLQAFPPPDLFFALLLDERFCLAEAYLLSCPVLSWRMVLIGDPLYNVGRAIRSRFRSPPGRHAR